MGRMYTGYIETVAFCCHTSPRRAQVLHRGTYLFDHEELVADGVPGGGRFYDDEVRAVLSCAIDRPLESRCAPLDQSRVDSPVVVSAYTVFPTSDCMSTSCAG